jgi:hypothetical protein
MTDEIEVFRDEVVHDPEITVIGTIRYGPLVSVEMNYGGIEVNLRLTSEQAIAFGEALSEAGRKVKK